MMHEVDYSHLPDRTEGILPHPYSTANTKMHWLDGGRCSTCASLRPEDSIELPPSTESSEVLNWPKSEIGNMTWDRETQPKGRGAVCGCASSCDHRLNNMTETIIFRRVFHLDSPLGAQYPTPVFFLRRYGNYSGTRSIRVEAPCMGDISRRKKPFTTLTIIPDGRELQGLKYPGTTLAIRCAGSLSMGERVEYRKHNKEATNVFQSITK
ncbi:hypothetical protein WG66_017110 [Moniliophthora roreri]|nr:hypothetical protein WG66_017110 [Moniliophthora roreri]